MAIRPWSVRHAQRAVPARIRRHVGETGRSPHDHGRASRDIRTREGMPRSCLDQCRRRDERIGGGTRKRRDIGHRWMSRRDRSRPVECEHVHPTEQLELCTSLTRTSLRPTCALPASTAAGVPNASARSKSVARPATGSSQVAVGDPRTTRGACRPAAPPFCAPGSSGSAPSLGAGRTRKGLTGTLTAPARRGALRSTDTASAAPVASAGST